MTRLVRAELLKLTTTRTPTGLLLAVVLVTAASVAGTVATGSLDHPEGGERLAQTATIATIFTAILGLLIVTTEFRHGTITQTFLVTPARGRVLLAKLAAGAVAGLAFGLAATAVALAMALPWTALRGDEVGGLGAGAAVDFVRLAGAHALWAALGVGIGALVRNQVGAIVGTFAWFLMIEPLLTVLGVVLTTGVGSEGMGPIGPYLPGTAFDALVGGDVGGERAGLLSPLAGLALVLAYVVALAAAGGLALVRRDPK